MMFSLRCRALAAVLPAFVVLLAYTAPASASFDEQKRAIVQRALDNAGAGLDKRAVLAAVDGAAALLTIDHAGNEDGDFLTIAAAGRPECRTFMLDKGRRMVIDLKKAINLQSGKRLDFLDHPVAGSLRTSLYSLQPHFVSRIVLDLHKPCTFRAESEGEILALYLLPVEDDCAPVRLSIVMNCDGTREMNAAPPVAVEEKARFTTLVKQLSAVAGGNEQREAQAESHRATGRALEALQAAMAEFIADSAVRIAAAGRPGAPVEEEPDSAMTLARTKAAPESAAGSTQQRINEKIVDLSRGLEAVSEVNIELGAAGPRYLAAIDEEAEPVPGEEAAAPDEVRQEEVPEPPGKREKSQPVTTEANSYLYSRMRKLVSELGSDEDSAAEVGVIEADAVEPVKTEDAQPVSQEKVRAEAKRKAEASRLARKAAGEKRAEKERKDHLRVIEHEREDVVPPMPQDPMQQLVNIDFRQMDLSNVVALLAHKAGINVIAGVDLSGNVTANLKNVPLRQAMDTALRMNGLGMIEEEGIYYIVPYDEAISAQRTTVMISLENAKAADIKSMLAEIKDSMKEGDLISISANDASNVVVISGPESRINELVSMTYELDVTEPTLPTVTEAIKINYAEPQKLIATLEKMISPEIGQLAADERARHVIVTDVPVAVEQVKALIKKLDIPVKQVIIDSMLVDAVLDDSAATGVDWILESVRRQSRRDAILDPGGRAVGNLQDLSLASDLDVGDAAGLLNFALLSADIDWKGVIQAEVRNRNGRLVSNPVLVTVENKPARITIAEEIPYVELTQTAEGGQQTSTSFKEVGTVLEVTPRVTHDDHIIVDVSGKESGTQGEFNGVPIENKREVESTLRMKSGQTIFIGGLRKNDKDTTIKKVPVLGDLPVLNFVFRSNTRTNSVNELMIFLTCKVLNDELPDLTPYQKGKYHEGLNAEMTVHLQKDILHDTVHPGDMRDPAWKFRRGD
jgi:type IV pilus assembly protein PilQ